MTKKEINLQVFIKPIKNMTFFKKYEKKYKQLQMVDK